jgi:hypothetical protein
MKLKILALISLLVISNCFLKSFRKQDENDCRRNPEKEKDMTLDLAGKGTHIPSTETNYVYDYSGYIYKGFGDKQSADNIKVAACKAWDNGNGIPTVKYYVRRNLSDQKYYAIAKKYPGEFYHIHGSDIETNKFVHAIPDRTCANTIVPILDKAFNVIKINNAQFMFDAKTCKIIFLDIHTLLTGTGSRELKNSHDEIKAKFSIE